MGSDNYELKSFSHSKGQNWYHVILVPRTRCQIFRYEATRSLCQQGIELTCKNNKIDLFTHEVIPGANHFFEDKIDELKKAVSEYLDGRMEQAEQDRAQEKERERERERERQRQREVEQQEEQGG